MAVAVVLPAAVVSAHSVIEATEPADGEQVVGSPATIGIRFDASMRITRFAVAGPTGPVALEAEPDRQPVRGFGAAPVAPLAAGAYRVEWRALAADGHVMSGEFRFTVSD